MAILIATENKEKETVELLTSLYESRGFYVHKLYMIGRIFFEKRMTGVHLSDYDLKRFNTIGKIDGMYYSENEGVFRITLALKPKYKKAVK